LKFSKEQKQLLTDAIWTQLLDAVIERGKAKIAKGVKLLEDVVFGPEDTVTLTYTADIVMSAKVLRRIVHSHSPPRREASKSLHGKQKEGRTCR